MAAAFGSLLAGGAVTLDQLFIGAVDKLWFQQPLASMTTVNGSVWR
ncbi:hypothetical protein [Streptomyces sp. NRRL F-2799]|nr:hypothetical protein [Streptomyces sp. NRRL F-2799]